MKTHLKVFLAAGGSYGFAMGGNEYSQSGDLLPALLHGALAGALFGAVFAAIIAWIARGRAGSYEPQQFRALVVAGAVSEVAAQIPAVIGVLKRSRLTSQQDNEFRALVGWSWKSWGENLTIRLRALNESQTLVEVACSPLQSRTLVDYGKSRENVDSVFAQLQARFAGSEPGLQPARP